MIYELPPMLSGTAEQQTAQLRAYLVRLANQLSQESMEREKNTTTKEVKKN